PVAPPARPPAPAAAGAAARRLTAVCRLDPRAPQPSPRNRGVCGVEMWELATHAKAAGSNEKRYAGPSCLPLMRPTVTTPRAWNGERANIGRIRTSTGRIRRPPGVPATKARRALPRIGGFRADLAGDRRRTVIAACQVRCLGADLRRRRPVMRVSTQHPLGSGKRAQIVCDLLQARRKQVLASVGELRRSDDRREQ